MVDHPSGGQMEQLRPEAKEEKRFYQGVDDQEPSSQWPMSGACL